ncbi:hypothetical protein [Azospirillum brasilense]|uniref:hypothetical protein n=1 Tax=Azospirillum brasilense TaxID=192 RepID=UPI0013B41555|nr:hypothetical protein [Azospirillum brasilense]
MICFPSRQAIRTAAAEPSSFVVVTVTPEPTGYGAAVRKVPWTAAASHESSDPEVISRRTLRTCRAQAVAGCPSQTLRRETA